MDLLTTFGRSHILLLHLPIGLVAGVIALEAVALRADPATPSARAAPRVLLWVLAGFAVFTAAAGWVLSGEGYKGDTLELHRWLGVALAGACMLTLAAHAWAARAPRVSAPARLRLYRGVLLLTALLTVVTGHLGGTLTHGDNFLFAAPRAPAPAPAANTPPATSPAITSAGDDGAEFVAVIQPILDASCIDCHGERRMKGGLALHTPRDLNAGGKHGPVVIAGDAANSELLRRLRLPFDDEDHMPPQDEPQLTAAEITAIEQWITRGAVTGPTTPTPSADRTRASSGGDRATPAPAASSAPAPPNPAALEALRNALVHVQPVAPDSPLLWVDFAAPAGAGAVTDERLATLLTPLAEYVQDLSLARTALTDRAATTLARLTNLRRLNLARTALTDAGLAPLSPLTALEELNLTGTAITDAALPTLAAFPKLARLYLWGTKVTPAAVATLSAQRPALLIDTGEDLTGRTLETEPPPTLTSPAKPSQEAPTPPPRP